MYYSIRGDGASKKISFKIEIYCMTKKELQLLASLAQASMMAVVLERQQTARCSLPAVQKSRAGSI